jgi:hypothetical protein
VMLLTSLLLPFHSRHLQQDNRVFLDLLWRYYEKNNNYGAAARILDQLAHREG